MLYTIRKPRISSFQNAQNFCRRIAPGDFWAGFSIPLLWQLGIVTCSPFLLAVSNHVDWWIHRIQMHPASVPSAKDSLCCQCWTSNSSNPVGPSEILSVLLGSHHHTITCACSIFLFYMYRLLLRNKICFKGIIIKAIGGGSGSKNLILLGL